MKTYRILHREIHSAIVEINAESESEALEKYAEKCDEEFILVEYSETIEPRVM